MMNVVFVEVKKLRCSDFNPPQRTDPKALQDLLESIKKGGIKHPLDVTLDNIVIDGHRRLACAKQLLHSKVPVIYHDAKTPESMRDLWWDLARSTRKMSPAEVLWFYSRGGKPDGHTGSDIERLTAAVGDDGVLLLAEMQNVTPAVIDEARKVARYCGRREDQEFIAEALWWLLKHKQRTSIRHVIDLRLPHTTLLEAIAEDRPIKFSIA